MLVLCFCLGIIIISAIILAMYGKLQITAQFIDDGENRLLSIEVVSFFLKKRKKEFRYDDIDLLSVLKQSDNLQSRAGFPGREFYGKFRQNLKTAEDYYKIFTLALKYTVVEKLEWQTVLGLDDAMNTAISTGSLWAFKGSFASLLSKKIRLQELVIAVDPDFLSRRLQSRLNCILKMRTGHIIVVGIYIVALKVRGYFYGYTKRRTVQTSY